MKMRTSKEKVTGKSDRYLLFINEHFSQDGCFPFVKITRLLLQIFVVFVCQRYENTWNIS